jgi:hypothetical protein
MATGNLSSRSVLPTSVVIVSILLILQALVRAAFLVIALLRIRDHLFILSVPQFLIVSLVLPALLAIGGLVGGILALCQSPAGRPTCLGTCALGLLLSLLSLGTSIYVAMTLPTYHFSWLPWILSPTYIAIYISGLIVFGQQRQSEAPVIAGVQ